MRIRLTGTPGECEEVLRRLHTVLGVTAVSQEWPNRRGDGGGVRVYVEARADMCRHCGRAIRRDGARPGIGVWVHLHRDTVDRTPHLRCGYAGELGTSAQPVDAVSEGDTAPTTPAGSAGQPGGAR